MDTAVAAKAGDTGEAMPERGRASVESDLERSDIPHVVIVGAGFGGLYAARKLGKRRVRITIVARDNYHLFQPLLYQVATAVLSPAEIAEPIRVILRKYPNVRVRLAEVASIDVQNHRVILTDGEVSYDYLILATGVRHSYFGRGEWEAVAPGLKSIADAIEIRRRILSAFEEAEWEADPAARQALLTFVVVGGGPTGVELAGAISEMARHTMAQDFRSIDPTQARVLLLEALPRIMPAFPEDIATDVQRALNALGVEVRTRAPVTQVTADAVHIGAERVPTRTTLWAAGIEGSQLGRSLGAPLDRRGCVLVEPDLTAPGHPEVYVVGDLASFPDRTGEPLPKTGSVAMQQGHAAARNIWRTIQGKRRKRFRYFNRGNMATIGRGKAVAEVRSVHLSGSIAWLAWLLVHIFFLIGFENRLSVLLKWTWSLLTNQRGSRVIISPRP